MKQVLYALAILLACNAGIGAFAQTTGEAQAPTNNFIRYPDTTSGTPSLAPLGSGSNPKLYIAYRANDPSGLLWINATQDGINLAGASVQNGIYMGSDPSLTSVPGADWMWIAYKATNNDSLWVCRGADGDNTHNTTTSVGYSCFYNVTKIQ